MTFETFVGASGNEKTRDAVLLEATRCIFGPAVTGYLHKQEDPSPHRIVEIIKSLDGEQ